MERVHLKANGTAYAVPKYIATHQAGYFKPLEMLKSPRTGIIEMQTPPNRNSNNKSTAEIRLQCSCKGTINFSSIFIHNIEHDKQLIGYGEPPYKEYLKDKGGKKPNPFYDNRNDGYLFIISKDFETIEILVIPNGRILLDGYLAKLADGQLDKELEELRKQAKNLDNE